MDAVLGEVVPNDATLDSDVAEEAIADNALAARDAVMLIERFREELRSGRAWWEALLEIVAVWELAEEEVDGRHYAYLMGGEALDWVCLAERLCDAVATEGLLPVVEVEELVVEGRLPVEMNEEALQAALGPTKYRAHLNFLYGVRVEEALQLSVEEVVQKERRVWAAGHDARADEDMFQRIYGAPRGQLLGDFRAEQERPLTNRISLSELKEFTYWLFKHRVATQDPARVASDTRRGLLRLSALEEGRKRRVRVGSVAAAEGIVVEGEVVQDGMMAFR